MSAEHIGVDDGDVALVDLHWHLDATERLLDPGVGLVGQSHPSVSVV
jgi:hypothetical protein